MKPDLKERFALSDGMGAPDLWGEAHRRAADERPSTSRSETVWGPDRHRLVTAAVAFAVFAAAALFAWDLSHPDVETSPPQPAVDPPVDLAEELPPGWSELPPPPEVRSGAATAWTGSELLVWGGYVFDGSGNKSPFDDGFAFDASSRTWTRISAGPLSWRSDAASAWTGEELLIWGGWTGDCCEPSEMFLADGAAYDPAARTWRPIPDAPIEARAPFSVWTGRELIVWGSTDRSARFRDGAAYDPRTKTWRQIAEAPVDITDGTAVWTGREMIVFGAALHGGNVPETETAVGAAYDPETDRWRELPPSELSPQAATAAWTGREMVAWDYLNGTAAYDPATDGWRALERVPIDDFECTPQVVSIPGQVVFGNYCGITPVFSVTKDRWRDVSREDLTGWVLEPVAAGSAVLVMGHGLELSEVPDQEFQTRMLAWVPRSDPVEDEPSPFVPATQTVGDETRMPVVFPDGGRATLAYPVALDLAALGVQPDVSYGFRGRYQGPIVFLHDPDASVARYVEADAGFLINTTAGGLELFRARGEEPGFWIRFDLPSWTLLVPIEDPDGGAARAAALAADVAASLHPRETSTGFPIVQASGDAELLEGFGEAGGAQLAFGDASPVPDIVSQLDATVFLSPDGCTPVTDTDFPGGYGASCPGDGEVFASIYGDRGFVNSVIEGLRVEDVVPV